MQALQIIAKRKPKSVALTPVNLLAHFLFDFTVSSGMRVATFNALVDLGTPEGDEAVEQVLLQTQRNEDFGDFVGVLQRAGKLALLGTLESSKLSKTKSAILQDALGRR
jgi:hypothetical protein